MDTERLDRATRAMRREGIDLLICRLPENVTLLAGYYPLAGRSVVALPAGGEASVLAPDTEEREAAAGWWSSVQAFPYGRLRTPDAADVVADFLKAVRKRWAGRGGKVGFEGSFENVAPALLAGEGCFPALPYFDQLREVFGSSSLVDATPLIVELRARKTATEMERMRRASRVAACGLREFLAIAQPGRTEAEVAGQVAAAILRDGVQVPGVRTVNVFPQVSSGAERTSLAWRPCMVSSNRMLEDGDAVMLELGVVVDGFWADNTRTAVAGVEGAGLKEIREVAEAAQAEACRTLAPGTRCCDVDAAARKVIGQAGFGQHFVHVTGHGIGWRYHEPVPMLAPGNEATLQPGMVCSVEPGIYMPGVGGVRREDILAVTERGAENLTTGGGVS